MEQFLIELATKYQWFMIVCLVIGIFRMVFKPIMAIIESIVIYTPNPKDDIALAGFKNSKVYKAIIWIVDYLLSVKLPGQK